MFFLGFVFYFFIFTDFYDELFSIMELEEDNSWKTSSFFFFFDSLYLKSHNFIKKIVFNHATKKQPKK